LLFGEFSDLTDFRKVLGKDLALWLNASERPWATQSARATDPPVQQPSQETKQGKGEHSSTMTAAQREATLRRYLDHVISRNRYLQLQGIRSGGRLVSIELENIYITLKATRTRTLEAEEARLAEERELAPGEGQKLPHLPRTETVTVKVEEALA